MSKAATMSSTTGKAPESSAGEINGRVGNHKPTNTNSNSNPSPNSANPQQQVSNTDGMGSTQGGHHASLSPWQHLLDAFIAHCWVGPFVVMYWASTWNLVIGELIFPNDIYVSIWTSAGIGFGIYFLGSISQRVLYLVSRPKRDSKVSLLVSLLVSRGYTYAMAFASVNQWRSVWDGWNVFTSMSTNNLIGTFVGAYVVMFLLRCSAQVLAPPSVVALDVPLTTYYETSTYLSTKVGTWQHILDSLFTVTVVPFLFVTAWRGAWHLQDEWLGHDDPAISGVYSLALGYALAVVLLITRGLWKKLSIWSDSHFWLIKYIIEDTHSFLHSLVAISHWRGFWVLYEQDFLDYPFKFWLGHYLSYVVLTCCLCSNSLLPRGCMRDGSETKGKGIELDHHYFTNLWNAWKKTEAIISRHDEENQEKGLEMETLKAMELTKD